MARRKKKLTRRQTLFRLFVLLSFLLAILLSLLVANISGKFDTTVFLVTFFVVLVLLTTAYIVLSLPTVKGRIGEARVNITLNGLQKNYGGAFVHDIIVPGDEGKTSQIDHVYVCNKGLFVIETKNYAGRIYGTDNQKQWTQVLAYGHSKNKLYNPVMQNGTHIRRLKEFLPAYALPTSVVVFVRGNIEYIESDYVYDLHGLKQLVRSGSAGYSDEQVNAIVEAVVKFKENPAATNREHVANIKAMQRGIDEGICPRCGGKLVLRASQKDGRQFYGCSNYPKCRFTKPVE